FNLANFMKMHLYSAFSTLKIVIDMLKKNESIELEKLIAHGGIFKTKGVAQQVLSSALDNDITVMNTASEGGAWGIAILSYFTSLETMQTLEQLLNEVVFVNIEEETLSPVKQEVDYFNNYVEKMKFRLPI